MPSDPVPDDVAMLFEYIRQLEDAILLASLELQRPGGDVGFAARLLAVMAARIQASIEAAQNEMAAEAHRTLH
jgi:hypothetical protein